MTHVTCRLTAKNRDQLRNPTLGNRVRAAFTFYLSAAADAGKTIEIHLQPVYAQLPTSSDNVPLPAFAAAPAVQQSIDFSCPPGAQQQTRSSGVRRTNDGTDRQTDGRPTVAHSHALHTQPAVVCDR